MIWKPNTTVAAIVEQQGRFLLVEEQTADGLRLNQPAGHLEDGESLLQAVVRETAEETAYRFHPQALLGIYHWRRPAKNSTQEDITYIRFAFIGEVSDHRPQQALDDGIVRTLWMSADEVAASQQRLRSPQVLTCIQHYLAGQRFPLSLLTHL